MLVVQCGSLAGDAGNKRSMSRSKTGSCLFLDGSYPERSSPMVDGFPVDVQGQPARCHCTDGYGCQNCAQKMDQRILEWYNRWQDPTATSDKYFGHLFKQPPNNTYSTWAQRGCTTLWPAEATAASLNACLAGNGNCTEGCKANDPRPGEGSPLYKPYDICEGSGGPGWSLNDFMVWANGMMAPADLPDGKAIVYPLSARTNTKTSGFSATNLATGKPAPCIVGKFKNSVCEGDMSCGAHRFNGGVSGLCIPLVEGSAGAGQCACTSGYTGSRCQIQTNDQLRGSQEGDYTVGGSACLDDTDCGVLKGQKPNEAPGACVAQPEFGQKVCECKAGVFDKQLLRNVDYVCGSCGHQKEEVLGAAFGGTESCPCSTPSLTTPPGTYCARPSKDCDAVAGNGVTCFLIDVYGGGAKCESLWSTDGPGIQNKSGNMAMCPVPGAPGVCNHTAAKPCASQSVSGSTVIALAGDYFVGKDTAQKRTVYSVACPTDGATPPKISPGRTASPHTEGEYYVADAFAANFLDGDWGLQIYPTDELANRVNLTQTNTDGKYDQNTAKDHQWEPTLATEYDAVMSPTAFHVDIHVRAPLGFGHIDHPNSTNVCGWGTGQNIIITGPDGTRHDVRSVGGKKCDLETPLHEGDWILQKQALSRGENIFKVEVVPLGENCHNAPAATPVEGCERHTAGHYPTQNYTIHVQLPAKPFPWLYLIPVALMVLVGFIYGLFNCYIKYLRCWYKEKNHDPFLVRLLGRRLGHRSGAVAWESEWCFHCEQYVLAKIHIGEDVCQQCGNWL